MLEEVGTWHLETPPADVNVVGSKWVFQVKKDAASCLVHHKA